MISHHLITFNNIIELIVASLTKFHSICIMLLRYEKLDFIYLCFGYLVRRKFPTVDIFLTKRSNGRKGVREFCFRLWLLSLITMFRFTLSLKHHNQNKASLWNLDDRHQPTSHFDTLIRVFIRLDDHEILAE